MSQRIAVLAVVGPTASGKTAFGIELAKRFQGEIISADSMQVYRGMGIATAQPTPGERQGIPHHLIGFLPPEQPFNVARFVETARAEVEAVARRGKLPVVVGGTGLFVDALLENLTFSDCRQDPELRRLLQERAAREGGQALLEELSAFDPESARKLHPNNVGRIIRAIEIYRLSGITMSEQVRRSRERPSAWDSFLIGLDYHSREQLYQRINRRVDQMMEQGLLEEAQCFRAMPGQATARQAIGYKELEPYFTGSCSLEQAVERLKQATRRYAKRQLTWFRRNERIHWIYPDESGSGDAPDWMQTGIQLADDFLNQQGGKEHGAQK